MTITESTCGCNMTEPTSAERSAPCTCGCGEAPPTRDQQISELRSQRDALDQRLAALEQG